MRRWWLAVLVFGGVCLGTRERAEAGWHTTASLLTPREYHTATLLLSGKVLVTGGSLSGSEVSATEIFDPVVEAWAPTGALLEGRFDHTATLLPSGKVLVAGGRTGEGVVLGTAEIFDPATGAWSPAGELSAARCRHTATLLPNGKVLLLGGFSTVQQGGPAAPIISPELYDAKSNQWQQLTFASGSPQVAGEHTATLLPPRDANELFAVLIAAASEPGVSGAGPQEIFRYSTNGAWSVDNLSVQGWDRSPQVATLLDAGNVLIYGASYGVFDPNQPVLQPLLSGNLKPQDTETATLVPSGKVLLTSSQAGPNPPRGDETGPAEIFNPADRSFTPVALNLLAAGRAAVLLPDGGVLVTGGNYQKLGGETTDAEIFEEDQRGIWDINQTNIEGLALPSGSRILLAGLPSGRILAIVPSNGSSAASAFVSGDAVTWASVATPSPSPGRDSPLATAIVSWRKADASWVTKLLLSDGVASWYYDETSDRWSSPVDGVSFTSATPLLTGKVLLTLGSGSASLFDPSAQTLSAVNTSLVLPSRPTAIRLISGKVLLSGGTLSGAKSHIAEIYDPETGQLTVTGSLNEARSDHVAVLLSSGKVLVVGGGFERPSAEIYDPLTGFWVNLPLPADFPNSSLIATLLPAGKVVVSVRNGFMAPGASTIVKLFDPDAGTWEAIPPGIANGNVMTQVLLPSGKLLALGGLSSNHTGSLQAALYDPNPAVRTRSSITAPSAPPSPLAALAYDKTLTVQGTGLQSPWEASGGRTNNSAVNVPLAQLRSPDGRRIWFLSPSNPDFSDRSVTLDGLPAGSLEPGLHWLSTVVAGVPSDPVPVNVDCGAKYTAPVEQLDPVPALGTEDTATFIAHCAGAEHFQWKKDGLDLAGATGASYTTPPVTAADIGSRYSVVCRSRCDDVNAARSPDTAIEISDGASPQVTVISPGGGDLWVLGTTHTISWTMSDDGLICGLSIMLLGSNDGKNYTRVADLPVPNSQIPVDQCRFTHQVQSTFISYTVPLTEPRFRFYEIEAGVTDQAGKTASAQSNPFYIVDQASLDSVRTLILVNAARMDALSTDVSALGRLSASLSALEQFPNLPGKIIDLGLVASIDYTAWDTCQPSACTAAANGVLSQIRDYLSTIIPNYRQVQYMVLVGDDRIIPFARLKDNTPRTESAYIDSDLGLTSSSTVGAALAAGFYLSDDIIASQKSPFPADGVITTQNFLPGLAVGRLVETPDEISNTIANFLTRNGVLDLSNPGIAAPKVLVTGYDFLRDSANLIRDRWTPRFGAAVDASLLGPDWTDKGLKSHLAASPRLSFLNGHATHFEEGVPGASSDVIKGLTTADLLTAPRPDLTSGAVFAVGCHGGLTVPDRTGLDPDHSQDLPQTFLGLGAVSYVANSGYGWGLVDGIGYGERLMVHLVDQILAGGNDAVTAGDAVRQAKTSYFLNQDGFEGINQKTLFQWTLFGLPMYGIKAGGGSSAATRSTTARLLAQPREIPPVERIGPVVVTRRKVAATPPPFVTRLDLHFDFSGNGVYSKHHANGDSMVDDGSGCQDDPKGCYYTLNGLSTGETGLPILPYFIYDSRLSGTSQHGALWMGGTYQEEDHWKSVIAQASTNGFCTAGCQNGGALPRRIQPQPQPRDLPTATGGTCQPSDLDLSALLVVTAQDIQPADTSLPEQHRRFTNLDMEILYYNNPTGSGNCDRTGPTIGPANGNGNYHQVSNSTVTWAVPVTGDVWRVIVLYDLGPNAQGQGTWLPLELADDDRDGVWGGSLPLASGQKLSYLVETISPQGNVTWLDTVVNAVTLATITDVEPPVPAIASPQPTDTFGAGDTITLQGSATDSGGALAGSALSWTVLLHQGGQTQTVLGPAPGATVSFTAPPPASLAAAVNGYLEIQLTATSSNGSSTISQRLDPARVPLTFATQPAGLLLTVNGTSLMAPQSFTSWRGYRIDLAANPQTGAGGENYAFQSWSDGGGAVHTLVTPASPTTDTAVFHLAQTAGPLDFYTVISCRMVDTRLPSGPLGGPSLSSGQTRILTLAEDCGIPRSARMIAVSLSVVSLNGSGYITIYPAGGQEMTTSTINFSPGLTRSNNAIVDLGNFGTIAVTYHGSPGTVDLIVDAVGYFQ